MLSIIVVFTLLMQGKFSGYSEFNNERMEKKDRDFEQEIKSENNDSFD